MGARPTHCAAPGCGKPLPPAKEKGRPRKYCDDRCRYAKRDAGHGLVSWHASAGELASIPLDPLTHERRTLACVAELLLDGRTAAPVVNQAEQFLIEARTLSFAGRRIAAECPPQIGGPIGAIALDIRDALVRHLPHLEAELG